MNSSQLTTPDYASRQALFEGLARGQLDPKSAERIAAESGFEPLYQPPNPNHYRPLAAGYFTLAMALAWIAWRTEEAVRQAMTEFAKQRQRWKIVERSMPIENGLSAVSVRGHVLEEVEAPSAMLLMCCEACGTITEDEYAKMTKSVREAREELFLNASLGRVSGFGKSARTGKFEKIDDHLWSRLELSSDHWQDVLRYRKDLTELAFRDVLLPASEVLKCWPMSDSVADRNGRELQFTAWLTDEISKAPHRRALSRQSIIQKGVNTFQVSAKAAASIRLSVIEKLNAVAWNRSGRSPKDRS